MAALAESGQATGTWGRVDEAIAHQLRTQASMGDLRWFATVTHLGDSWVLAALTVAVTAALWWRKHRLLAVGWFVAMAGNGLLTKILKDVFARVRPEHVHGAAQADGFSFPSGHSSASIVAYAMLAYLAVRLLPRRWHLPAACTAGALVFTTGFSRVVGVIETNADEFACASHAGTNTITYVVSDPEGSACAVIDSVMDIDYAAGRITYDGADTIIRGALDLDEAPDPASLGEIPPA